jgi:hypothetical protein
VTLGRHWTQWLIAPRQLRYGARCPLDNGREATPEMVRQELGYSYRSPVLEDRYVKRARLLLDRVDPFEFRIERYADRPEIAERLDRMRALDAAGVPPLSTAAEAARAERQELIRAFLEAVDGLSMAAAMEVSGRGAQRRSAASRRHRRRREGQDVGEDSGVPATARLPSSA